MYIGAESTGDSILESLAKDFKREDIINTANLLKKKKIPVTWFIMLGALAETRETILETLNTMGRLASKWDLVFVSTGIRVYNGSPLAEEIMKHDIHFTSDNFLRPVKIEPEKIGLADIHTIAKRYSFQFPNFYFYEKEHIIPGWILIIGNSLLKVFHSSQPVWRLLILLKRIEWALGIVLVKKSLNDLKMSSSYKKSRNSKGFSIIREKKITIESELK